MKDEKDNSVSAPVQPGPRPKCPKCHSFNFSVAMMGRDNQIGTCGRCDFNAPVAAFFPVAAPSAPRPEDQIINPVESWAVIAARKIVFPDGVPQEGYDEDDVNEVAKLILVEYLNRLEICGNCAEVPCICGTSAWRTPGSEFDRLKAQKDAILAKLPDSIPMVKRATGRTIPDLTKREHICEYQTDLLEQIESLRRRVPAGQGCSCESGNHANATECHNFGANGCTGATTQGTPEGK